jgi:hypothetical protein
MRGSECGRQRVLASIPHPLQKRARARGCEDSRDVAHPREVEGVQAEYTGIIGNELAHERGNGAPETCDIDDGLKRQEHGLEASIVELPRPGGSIERMRQVHVTV